MQVLFAPLRALLFCFEFVFGNGSRIKSCLTPFFSFRASASGRVKACLEDYASLSLT